MGFIKHITNEETGHYKCGFCKKICKSLDELTYHATFSGHNGDACTLCGKAFMKLLDIYAHVEEHYGKIFTEGQPFSGECCICNKVSRGRRELLHHLQFHLGEKPFMCCVCQKKFTLKISLLVHMKQHERKSFRKIKKACPICDVEFLKLVDYCDHMQTHTMYTPECSLCDRAFIFEVSLKEHMKFHKDAKETACIEKAQQKKSHSKKHHEKSYLCSLCQKVFNSRYKLRCHSKIHVLPKGYMCRVCKRVFRFKSLLENHLRKQHRIKQARVLRSQASYSKDRNIQKDSDGFCCPVCQFKTKFRLSIKNHMLVHDKNRQMYPCGFCEKEFGLMHNLKKHMLICRGNNGIYPSGSSEKKVFKNVAYENKLDNRITKPHVCGKCGKSFMYRKSFIKHFHLHSRVRLDRRLLVGDQKEKRKEKPQCYSNVIPLSAERADSSRSSVVNRSAASSTNIKPYSCDKCGRSFSYRKSFIKHCRFHSDHKVVVSQENEMRKDKPRSDSGLHVCNVGNSSVSITWNCTEQRGPKTYSCRVCQRQFEEKCYFVEHLSVHKNLESYFCDKCTQCFRDAQLLMKHWDLHHAGESLNFIGNVPWVEVRKSEDGISPINVERTDAEHLEGGVCNFLKTDSTVKGEEEELVPVRQELDVHISCILCDTKFSISEDLIRHMEACPAKNSGSYIPDTGTDQESSLESFTADNRVENSRKTHGMRGSPRVKQISKKYVCNVCQKEFKSEKFFRRHNSLAHSKVRASRHNKFSRRFTANHKKKHPRAVKFPCNICGRQFTTKNMLVKHIKIHRQEDKSRYKRSDEKHQHENDINKQQEAHCIRGVASSRRGRDDIVCSDNAVCVGEKNPQKSRVGGDAQSPTKDGTHHSCDVCGKTYKCDHQLHHHHIVSHVKGKLFSCPLCSKLFNVKLKLLKHLKAHGKRDNQVFDRGDQNGSTDSSDASAKFHVLETHTNGTESQIGVQRMYACSICKETYESEIKVWYHYIYSHFQAEQYKCPYCKRPFHYKFSLVSHLRSHARSCEFCNGYNTIDKEGDLQTAASGLVDSEERMETHEQSHLIQEDEGIRKLRCSVCRKTFKGKRPLMSHILLTHGSKTYSCENCGRDFGSKLALCRHASAKQCTVQKTSKTSRAEKLQRNSELNCEGSGKKFCKDQNLLCHNEIHNGENMATNAGKKVNECENPSDGTVFACMTGRHAESVNLGHESEESMSLENSVPNNSSENFCTRSSNLTQKEQIYCTTEIPEPSFALDNVADINEDSVSLNGDATNDSFSEQNEGFFSSRDNAEENNSNEYSVLSNLQQSEERVPHNGNAIVKSSPEKSVSCDDTKKKQEENTTYKQNNNALGQPGTDNLLSGDGRRIACLECREKFLDVEVYLKHYPCSGISTKKGVVDEGYPMNDIVTKDDIDFESDLEYDENVSVTDEDNGFKREYNYASLVDGNSAFLENHVEETVGQKGLSSVLYCVCCVNKRSVDICSKENPNEHTGKITPDSHVYADSITSSRQGCNTTSTSAYADNSMSGTPQVSNSTGTDVHADGSMTVCTLVSTETSTLVGTHGGVAVSGSEPDIMSPALNVHDSAYESTGLDSDIFGGEGNACSDSFDCESSVLLSGNNANTITAGKVHNSSSGSTVVDTVGDIRDITATSSLSIRDCTTVKTSESVMVNTNGSCDGKMLNTLGSPNYGKLVAPEDLSLDEKRLNAPRRYSQETVRGTVTIVALNSRTRESQEPSNEEITVKFSHPRNYRTGRNKAHLGNVAAANLCEFLIIDNWMGI